jgi:peroxiredoxin
MSNNIIYKNETMNLIDDAMEEGYMAQAIHVNMPDDQKCIIKRSHGDTTMTILYSVPNLEFRSEILELDSFLAPLQVPVKTYLLLNQKTKEIDDFQNKLKRLEIVYDTYDEFGTWYGTKITNGSLEGALCKSLFLISREGAIFYVDMPFDLSEAISIERLHAALNKAYTIYTGVGCHE